jgi:D-beta-D-heptose 7-phosphate kinase / D-beta-D-heptose 1-phosphate adenosyltransferase
MLLVMGDVMVDVYVDGLVHRISPDAPVPVLLRTSTRRRMSGACIGARAARDAAGIPVCIVAVVGDNEPAEFLRSALLDAGVSSLLGTVAQCRSITKTRFATGAHQLLRVDEDSTFAEHADEVEQHMLESWRAMRRETSVLLFSDYAKGALSDALIRQVISEARADGTTIVVDSKRRDVMCYARAHAWTPNVREIIVASGRTNPEEASTSMREQLDLEAVILTCAENGAIVTLRDGSHRYTAAPALDQVHSVAGAGDVLAGVVAARVSQGLGWTDAASDGVAWATRFVGHPPAD